MASNRPLYRGYISDEEGNLDFSNEDFSLWERVSTSGKKYFSGTLGDGRRVQLWPATFRDEDDSDFTSGVEHEPSF